MLVQFFPRTPKSFYLLDYSLEQLRLLQLLKSVVIMDVHRFISYISLSIELISYAWNSRVGTNERFTLELYSIANILYSYKCVWYNMSITQFTILHDVNV